MLAKVVTPVSAKVAPDASFVDPASPVFETSVRTPSLVVAPPNGVAVAATAADTRTEAAATAAAVMISRFTMSTPLSGEIHARWCARICPPDGACPFTGAANLARTESLRAGDRRDVRGDVLDLLLGE